MKNYERTKKLTPREVWVTKTAGRSFIARKVRKPLKDEYGNVVTRRGEVVYGTTLEFEQVPSRRTPAKPPRGTHDNKVFTKKLSNERKNEERLEKCARIRRARRRA